MGQSEIDFALFEPEEIKDYIHQIATDERRNRYNRSDDVQPFDILANGCDPGREKAIEIDGYLARFIFRNDMIVVSNGTKLEFAPKAKPLTANNLIAALVVMTAVWIVLLFGIVNFL